MISQLLHQRGWRRTGAINSILASACAIILTVCLLFSISRPNSSLYAATIIFEGNCDKSSRLNLILHLLINISSSAALASSNFFMQVLSSPSLQEIDQAHVWLRSLDIGIPSLHNLRLVSPFKSVGWFALLISSVPIHLLFNSAIFETTFYGSDWHLTIATEAYTQGADFFPPGASLAAGGAPGPIYSSNASSTNIEGFHSYGNAVDMAQYWDRSSRASRDVYTTSEKAHKWIKIDSLECQSQYRSYAPITKYGNVVVIIESATSDSDGWKRNQVFDFQSAGNLSNYWDSHIPPKKINSLWYSTQCSITRTQGSIRNMNTCTNTCLAALGLTQFASTSSFTESDAPEPEEPWILKYKPFPGHSQHQEQAFGYNHYFDFSLRVRYCLAEPIHEQCKVGLSNSILLIIIFCIFVKTFACTLVLWLLPSTSLVNPGDVMQSFILKPDPMTSGLGSLDLKYSQALEVSHIKPSLHMRNIITPLGFD